MDWSLEVVVLPVSDIDRSVVFYRDKVGFHLDRDTRNEHMHVVQLTPPGSGSRTRTETPGWCRRARATNPLPYTAGFASIGSSPDWVALRLRPACS